MRRTIVPAALALAAVVGLAAPAMADETPSTAPTRPIHLTCSVATADQAKPSISCSWDAYDGATKGYRVVRAARRGRAEVVRARKTTDTSFTEASVAPGHYSFVVQALGDDGRVVARSNRAVVDVKRERRTTQRS